MTQVQEETEIKGGRGRPSLVYTAEELAGFYQVSEKTIFRWAAQGDIPFVKKGHTLRFPKNLVNPILQREGLLAAA